MPGSEVQGREVQGVTGGTGGNGGAGMQQVPVPVAPALRIGSAEVRCGAGSWADRSLVKDSDWYPKSVKKAADRLAHYATTFPVVEVSATQHFPPTPDFAQQWVDRTPDGFRMDVLGWNLLSGVAAMPDSLFADLQDEVKPEARDKRRLYLSSLTAEAQAECWIRFAHALQPMVRSGRLGCVTMRYPPWLRPGRTAERALLQARERLADIPIAVELRNHRWYEGGQCEETLALLEDLDLSFVCLDAPATKAWNVAPVVAATNRLAVVRFVGRRSDPDDPWPWPYRYTDADLVPWIPHVVELAESADEIHLLFVNTWRDDAVDGAAMLSGLLDDK